MELRLTNEQANNLLANSEIDRHSSDPLKICECQDSIPCDVIFNGGSIDPHGDVFACNQLRVKGGNILEKSLIDIWKNSPEFQRLRAVKLKHLFECKDCDLFSYCERCPGLAYLEDGNLLGCSTAAKRNAIIRKELGVYPFHPHIFGHST